MRRGAHTPIYNPATMYGSVNAGAMVGTLPTPAIPTLDLHFISTVVDNTHLGDSFGVAYLDGHAWVTQPGSDEVTGVNVSNPASPSVVGHLITSTQLDGCYFINPVQGKGVMTGCVTDSMFTTLDVSTPASPAVAGTLTDGVAFQLLGCNGAVASADGTKAYVTGRSAAAVSVVDISTWGTPVKLGGVENFTTLTSPGEIVLLDTNHVVVVSQGNNRLLVIDVSNPASPSIAGSVQHATNLASVENVAMHGTVAVCTSVSGDRVTTVDCSTPTAPAILGTITHSTNLNGARGVRVWYGYAIVVCRNNNSIVAIDLTDPTTLAIADNLVDGTFVYLDQPENLAINGNVAYVANDGGNNLTVVGLAA